MLPWCRWADLTLCLDPLWSKNSKLDYSRIILFLVSRAGQGIWKDKIQLCTCVCRRADWVASHWAAHSMVSAQQRVQTGRPGCRRKWGCLHQQYYTQAYKRWGDVASYSDFSWCLWDQDHGIYKTQKLLRESQALSNSENFIAKRREVVPSPVTKRGSAVWQDSPKLLQTRWSLLWPQRGRRQRGSSWSHRPSKRTPANPSPTSEKTILPVP